MKTPAFLSGKAVSHGTPDVRTGGGEVEAPQIKAVPNRDVAGRDRQAHAIDPKIFGFLLPVDSKQSAQTPPIPLLSSKEKNRAKAEAKNGRGGVGHDERRPLVVRDT